MSVEVPPLMQIVLDTELGSQFYDYINRAYEIRPQAEAGGRSAARQLSIRNIIRPAAVSPDGPKRE